MDNKTLEEKLDRLNRFIKILFLKCFDGFELTAMQALTLEYIFLKGEHGDIFPKDLEAGLSIRGSSVTSLINNLEASGYIRRESAEFDGRYKRLLPTKKALKIKPEISERMNKFSETLFVGISDNDLKVFESVIEKMMDNIK